MQKIAVIIPCYKVDKSLHKLLNNIGNEVSYIYCVDDACPNKSYKIAEECSMIDSRIKVIRHSKNQGEGAAMKTGYTEALKSDANVLVKMDGDGQMDPYKTPKLVKPITDGDADYVKGNRFFNLEGLGSMPYTRLFGNIVLSLLSKISTGYWHLFDPTNGFTAIHRSVLLIIPLEKLHKKYFFESDLLFRLNIIHAVVAEVPIPAIYEDEESNLNIFNVILTFPFLHFIIFIKRIIYNYYLRNFSVASLNLVIGLVLIMFGSFYGISKWVNNLGSYEPTPAGIVMMSALPIIIGFQLILNFLSYDIERINTIPIHKQLQNNYEKS